MKIKNIKDILDAEVIVGNDKLDIEVKHIYASDLMSDVLAFGEPNSLLLTGLASQQAIISAHMAEFDGVVLIRGKKAKDGSEKFARDKEIVLLSTRLDMYDACVRIGLMNTKQATRDSKKLAVSSKDDIILSQEFSIDGNDFTNAGMASTEVKSVLKKIGLDPVPS